MVRKLLIASISVGVISCGGGGGGGGAPPTYSLGGTVSGLAGAGLTLNASTATQNIATNGAFTIAGVNLTSGSMYNVAIAAQPNNPSQTCVVSGGAGTIGSANVTSIQVTCTTNIYSVGGTVSGLEGTGLVLQNNGGDDLTVAANGAVTFGTNVASGATYSVTVRTVPTVTPAQTCEVATGAGTVGSSPVTNVQISCRAMTGRFLYAANSAGTAIGSPVAAGAPVGRAVLHPSGDFLYVRHNDNTTSGFTINPTTGELATPIGSVPSANGFGIVFAQGGRYVYLDALGTTFVPPSTTIFGPGSIAGYGIDQGTGALLALSGSPYNTGGNSAIAIAINARSNYVAITNLEPGGAALPTIAVFEVDDADGTLAHVVGSPFLPTQGTTPGAVILDPSGQYAYLSDNTGDFVSAYRIDETTGEPDLIATYPTGDAPTGFLRIVGLQ